MWMNTVQRTKETAGQDIDEGAIWVINHGLCHGLYMVWACSPKAYVLEAQFLVLGYWEVVEPLRCRS
jgi:hypothetical protein